MPTISCEVIDASLQRDGSRQITFSVLADGVEIARHGPMIGCASDFDAAARGIEIAAEWQARLDNPPAEAESSEALLDQACILLQKHAAAVKDAAVDAFLAKTAPDGE